ncbi:hypothetical protein [Nocardia cyriacigeorgica]|uniref:hypothetical protein n=1 Tax=Nocardia cyriacigeorgica TaxID=135487 RepID=UPI002453DD41|nr:hypothetical protein [Nocardia cyriacigeorgica]
MTNDDDTTAAHAATETTTEATEQQPAGEHEANGNDRPSRQAARYRARLREVEGERDQLRATVEALQRAAIEDAATRDGRVRVKALFATLGDDLAPVLAEDGSVDAAKLDEVIAQTEAEYGSSGPRTPIPNPWAGGSQDGCVEADWVDAFRPPRR